MSPRSIVAGALRLYKLLISPLLPPACRFQPSCSEYAIEAVETYGVARGAWLALKRLSRCHPWSAGGFDPVPGIAEPPPGACTGAPGGRSGDDI